MKKYLFGIFAIVLAVSLTAFTSPKKNAVKGGFTEHAYAHWYTVVNGVISTEQTAFQNETKTTVIGSQACKDTESPACLVGSDSELSPDADLPDPEQEPGNSSNNMNYILHS